MKRVSIVVLSGAIFAAAACGRVAPLHPAKGVSLPVRPLLARTTPTAAELLAYPTQARPQRVDELVTKSEPRKADRFDLPPPDGGPAPVAGADPEVTNSDDQGPVKPQ